MFNWRNQPALRKLIYGGRLSPVWTVIRVGLPASAEFVAWLASWQHHYSNLLPKLSRCQQLEVIEYPPASIPRTVPQLFHNLVSQLCIIIGRSDCDTHFRRADSAAVSLQAKCRRRASPLRVGTTTSSCSCRPRRWLRCRSSTERRRHAGPSRKRFNRPRRRRTGTAAQGSAFFDEPLRDMRFGDTMMIAWLNCRKWLPLTTTVSIYGSIN